ncbi:extensin family protein [Mongoliimonas terrestris]|uniref:extensin-like domain-containing protein n=1 Tax=Mongoliimonas terrestris TaxID=1709001 RepID=UPI0009495501|nr:extensin family protein [Mongoliimonas terrestris]
MAPGSAFRAALLVFLSASLAGCGLFDWEEREPWRAQAEAACFARKQVKLSPLITPAEAIQGKGICGLDRPLRVSALADGTVRIGSRAVVMSCPMTAALEAWVQSAVMPAAYERYGVPVVEIRSMGTYNCRSRNNVPGARLSEHAFANAFDVGGFVLANGYTVTVKKGWRGSPADRAFLRQVHAGACGPFTTVLGPGSDGKHEDHLHLDLARHNAKGTYRYCRPTPKMPAPSSEPPPFQMDQGIPVAQLPQSTDWPHVLPQSVEAQRQADAAAGYDLPLPPGRLSTDPLPPAPPQGNAGWAPPPQGHGGWTPPQDYGQPAGGYGVPLPPASVPNGGYAQPAQPAYPPPQPAGCPPGYICTPAASDGIPPPPPGWSVGPQPLQGYAPDGILFDPDDHGDWAGALDE